MEAARAALSERMALLRSEAGLSQRAAARKCGMDQKHWSLIENRQRNPGLDSLLRIQFALDLPSLEVLFGDPATKELLAIREKASATSETV